MSWLRYQDLFDWIRVVIVVNATTGNGSVVDWTAIRAVSVMISSDRVNS